MKDILKTITDYRLSKNYSEYTLAQKSELPQSTISSWYRKNMLPSIPSLAKICDAFGITLSQFFAEEDEEATILTPEEKALIKSWERLTPEQQKVIAALLLVM